MSTQIAPYLKADWPYQNSEAVMLLYNEKITQVFPETFLASMYMRLKEDNLLDTMFPGMNMGHLNRFIEYWGSQTRLGRLVCCMKDPGGPPKPIGLGWLCEAEQGRGSFGFGFFKEAHRRHVHIDLSMMMLHNWFYECKLEVLYGTTLNPIAKNYSKRFGFRYLCELPKFFPHHGKLVNAHLIVLEKDVFSGYYRDWLSKRG
jgi:hypothetical protein